LGAAVDAAGKATGAFTYGIIGTTGWFLTGAANDVAVLVLFFFMMVFMDTTATIPTGAMAERWSWKNFVLYGFWVALLIACTRTGSGVVAGWLRAASTGVLATAL